MKSGSKALLNAFFFIKTCGQDKIINWSVVGPEVMDEKTQAPKSFKGAEIYTEADRKGKTRFPFLLSSRAIIE